MSKAPFGLWQSPIESSMLMYSTVRLSQVRVDGQDTYWVEGRPEQNGRNVLLRRRVNGTVGEFLPLTPNHKLFDVRTKVHEYGGKAYCVSNGVIVASNCADSRVYKYDVNNVTQGLTVLTPYSDYLRFADFELDLSRNVVYAICEDHTDASTPKQVKNYLVKIPLDGSASRDQSNIQVVFEGSDFASSPSISPDGKHIAWISWNLPNMPWDQTKLHVAKLDADGNFVDPTVVVDSENVSVSQPRWFSNDILLHVNDSSGYNNFYRTEGFESQQLKTRHLHPSTKVFSYPQWQVGLHTYDILDEHHIVTTWYENGTSHIGTLRIENGELEEWEVDFHPMGNVASADNRVITLANSPLCANSVVQIKNSKIEVFRQSLLQDIPQDFISVGEHITWQTSHGQKAHGFYYEPKLGKTTGLDGTKPPVIVEMHGGPTAQTSNGMSYMRQYWTSRGFAVLDVNYRGSTGYGRKYQDSLNGNWGVYDIDDCVSGVKYLIEQGKVDPTKVAIHGGSAGGYAVLQALSTTDVFTAGVSLYGICDLRTLAQDTHKFESEYMFKLLGSSNTSDSVWTERSPINHISNIHTPILLLQGDQDAVVPLQQAEAMYKAMVDNNQEVELVVYEGEGHGFIKGENIQDAIEREYQFYLKTWNIS